MWYVWVLALLLCNGCTGQVIEALEQRQMTSCVWWKGPLGYSHGVTATGGATLAQCLAVPCQMAR